MKVRQILSTKSRELVTITPEKLIQEAVNMLTEQNIGALLVVEGEDLVGIISERDIIHKAAASAQVLSAPVREAMTESVITGVPEDDLMSVASTMTDGRFRHLPILDEGKLIGIISIGDVMKAQRDRYRGEIDTLETQLMADQE